MPPPSVLQVGSVATFGPTQSPLHRSLQPLRASLHFSTATRAKITARFSAPLISFTQTEHKSLSIKRRAAEVSNEGKTEEEEKEDGASIAQGPDEAEVSNEGKTEEEEVDEEEGASIAQGPDEDEPEVGQQFAQFGAGRFWFPAEAFRRVPGVTKIELGYSQGLVHNPNSDAINRGNSGHAEVVRVQYDPTQVSYDQLLDVFWECHDPTQKNRQGFFLGSQFRSGIYFYSPEQEKAARQSLERQEKKLDKKIVTEILPAKKFYRAENTIKKKQRWERRLLGGQKLSATWLNGQKLLAAKGEEEPVKG